jgi:hypothetical protein
MCQVVAILDSLPPLILPHRSVPCIFSQGDSELDGTGIETSLTGRFKISVIKQADFEPWQEVLDFPLGETADEYIVHGFTETDYLATFPDDPSQIYGASSIDKAMMNAYTQTRKFLMAKYGMSEIEANTFITEGIDFGMTQLVDGNWGVHGIVPKAVFESMEVMDGEETGNEDDSGNEDESSTSKVSTVASVALIGLVGLLVSW